MRDYYEWEPRREYVVKDPEYVNEPRERDRERSLGFVVGIVFFLPPFPFFAKTVL